MSLSSDRNHPTTTSDCQELAAAIDRVISAQQAGITIDRSSVLERHPELAPALEALDRLCRNPAATTDKPALSGTIENIGPYRIEGELGSGGFGVVYKAYDPVLKRTLALKVLHAGRLSQGEAVERFLREARATAKLQHPGIVHLCDYSRDGPPYYLATEYIDGHDLQTWCLLQQATPAQIADLVARVAETIDEAHAHGVYHRDLKPANILVDERGDPKVLDFGLALIYDEKDAAPTSDGRVLGTLAYMAPEQAAGHSHQADARSDIYSLGVILYELLTLRQPFTGPPHLMPSQVIEGNVPHPRQFNASIPRDLEAICLKAMAKKPDDRYCSAAAFGRDLRAFLRGEPVEAQPYTWIVHLQKTLDRRHQDTVVDDWSKVLVLEACVILTGCTLEHIFWNSWRYDAQARWLPMLFTKIVQIVLMLYLAMRFRPRVDGGLSSVEKQIWSLLPAYFGGFLAIIAVRSLLGLGEGMPLSPFLAVLSGMVFVTLGAKIWGWFYVWGAFFFALAAVIALYSQYGQLLLGLGWFVCLIFCSWHLRWTK